MHLAPSFVTIIFWWIESSLSNKTEKFPTHGSSGYHVVKKNDINVTLLCDISSPSNITIRNDDRRVLNQTTGYRLYYVIDNIRCEDSGTYVCDIFSNHTNESRRLELAVVCPPRLCSGEESNKTLDVVLYTNVSFYICVLVPYPYTSIQLRISYKDQWFSNWRKCTHRVCIDWSQDNISIFRFIINITIVNITEEDLGEFRLKIGTNFNFRDNYINYTCVFQQKVPKNSSIITHRTTKTDTSSTFILEFSLTWVFLLLILLTLAVLSRFNKVKEHVTHLRLGLLSKCACLQQGDTTVEEDRDLDNDYLSLFDFCPERNPELSVENPYNDVRERNHYTNDYDDIPDIGSYFQDSEDYITVL